jgi:2,3,4,5-tetrahydropyridine-2-carboxylate N-succinyltransferase
MSEGRLQADITQLERQEKPDREAALEVVGRLLDALESGRVRAAQPVEHGWQVNPWVKQGILLGFKVARNLISHSGDAFHFRDRDIYTTRVPDDRMGDVRIVPGGSTVRRGSFIGSGVVVMPPAYVNVGAYVDRDSMVDSHALVGSCAQIGRGVHLSAGVQVGGVLEPVGALPVVIEDGSFIGGGCGIYEGTRICQGAVLAPGVVLSRSIPVYDTVRENTIRADRNATLVIPEGAVVVPGSRPASGRYAQAQHLHLQAPLIVKYRDSQTTTAVTLEEALR